MQKLHLRLKNPEDRVHLDKAITKLGIKNRHTVLENPYNLDGQNPGAFYNFENYPGTEDRMMVYQEKAFPLAKEALEPMLDDNLREKITHLIVTTCTGFYCPGLDHDIVTKLGLKPNMERQIIGFMACYAAVMVLCAAKNIIEAQPDATVMMVNLELCSLHLRKGAPLDQVITFLLFVNHRR